MDTITMNTKDFIQMRGDKLAQEIGAMSLARIALEAHNHQAVLDALRLIGVWLTRDLTDREFVDLRQAADDLGIDLMQFDLACAQQEKEV